MRQCEHVFPVKGKEGGKEEIQKQQEEKERGNKCIGKSLYRGPDSRQNKRGGRSKSGGLKKIKQRDQQLLLQRDQH